MTSLFEPLTVGNWSIPNRVLMAAMTRCRASGLGRIPNEMMAEYYAQRAGAGLILSEATAVTPGGVGYRDTPGIWSTEQVDGWKLVTNAVHAAGGKILLQLWHAGRMSHDVYLDGRRTVAPSALQPIGHVHLLRPRQAFPVPRALRTSEMPHVVEAFGQGSQNAMAAGFDGVHVHAANGYLLDQFLQDSTNQRDDQYGGSIANRARLLLEVTDAAVSVWGPGSVGVHISPRGDVHFDGRPTGDSDPRALFTYVASELGAKGIAFLSVREYVAADSIGPVLKAAFGGTYFANEGFTAETAATYVAEGNADAVLFAEKFLANPDLPLRFAHALPLNDADLDTFYEPGPRGYTDYPVAVNAASGV